MNRLKKKVKSGVLFLTAAAMFFSVSGFGIGTIYAQGSATPGHRRQRCG